MFGRNIKKGKFISDSFNQPVLNPGLKYDYLTSVANPFNDTNLFLGPVKVTTTT